MKFVLTSSRINIVLILLLLLLGIGSFAYNQYLIENIREQERSSVELWARAVEYNGRPIHEEISEKLLGAAAELRQNSTVPDSVVNLIEEAENDHISQNFVAEELVIKDRFNIPSIVVDERGEIIFMRNIEEEPDEDLINQFMGVNPPIEISFGDNSYSQTQTIYYGESPTIRLLRYFPYIQLSLLTLLLGLAYFSYKTVTRSEQSNLWVGMAKEAAHQLGTPLSSLYGWIELLREEHKDEFTQNVSNELEKDISRVQGVAERFNKIGSEPELSPQHIEPILDQVIDYMERRLPQYGKRHIEVQRVIKSNAKVRVNPELFQWAVENLMKNAMDAVKTTSGEAYVSVQVHRIENELMIDVEDSGVGIEKKYHEEVFKPGYSTKKRGWGLGLSLTRRIIEDYHQGKVFILHSAKERGTTIRIVLQLEAEEEQQAVLTNDS